MRAPQALPATDAAVGDLAAIASSVERFCRGAIDPRVARWEHTLSPADLEAIAAEARDLGIVPAFDAPGFAIWEDDRIAASLATLIRLGESCAGVAFHLHRLSLVGLVARALGSPGSARPALHLGNLSDPDDGGSLLVHAAESWDELWMPADGERWLRVPRSSLAASAVERQHGLDEVRVWDVRIDRIDAAATVAQGETARLVLQKAAAASALGMVAIALGGARHALRLAQAHAATRRQGGVLIREHPAVQGLLGEAASAIATVASALRGVGGLPASEAGLAEVVGVRVVAHRLLCEAANASLQVLGGVGYMRDTGLEKIVRDLNHLRLLEGAPADLFRFVAREGQP